MDQEETIGVACPLRAHDTRAVPPPLLLQWVLVTGGRSISCPPARVASRCWFPTRAPDRLAALPGPLDAEAVISGYAPALDALGYRPAPERINADLQALDGGRDEGEQHGGGIAPAQSATIRSRGSVVYGPPSSIRGRACAPD